MTVNLKINLRPATGPFKSPKDIAQFYNSIDGWQECLPKTDNTYSPKSKYYKYEVSPGIRFIPNMSRSPLKSYEKTPMKLNFSKDQTETFFTSSHIKRKLFKSTTYQHYNITNYQTHRNETRTVYQSAQIFVNLLISYFISTTEVHGTVMEIGSNLINSAMLKITNWAHLFSINTVYLDLIITTAMRKVVDQYFGYTKLKNLLLPILLSVLILFLTVGFLKYATYLDIPVWHDSWTNFLLSPFISILNLITSIYQTFTSTMSFVLDLISVTCASSIIVFKLCGKIFVNVFHNIDTITDSAGHHVSTIAANQNSRLIPFDYDLLAKKVIASEEFQHFLINQLNISRSDLSKLHDQEFQKRLTYQLLQDINTENLNWINEQLNDQRNILENINDQKSHQNKEVIQEMENKISELKNTVGNLISNFETYKSESTTIKINSQSTSKEACLKDNWHSIINYIENYVNMTMKSTINIYDADKTGMVDYALESAGAMVLGTRCTQTKAPTAALTIFNIAVWSITSNGPRLAIQPGVNPGQCWAFVGGKGYLVLQLSNTIHVTGFTIEHLPRSLSKDGHIKSAPKDFSVWGLKHETDLEGQLLGKDRFLIDGPSLQYFSALKTADSFSIVELRIESNHGHEEYTCLYRIRIHGELAY